MESVRSLFFKNFHRESKPSSKLFKADFNENFGCVNGLKSRVGKFEEFELYFGKISPIFSFRKIYFENPKFRNLIFKFRNIYLKCL
jgi:hypothetical protein